MSLLGRIREFFAGRFIEDPLFGTLCYGRERTYTVDHVTRRFEPVGWTNSWQGSMVFDPLATKIPVWIRTESEQGPTEHHREVYRQLNWRWPFLELPIAEQLIPLCHEWCKGLFNDFELSPQTAHAFYSDIIEVQGMTICDWSPSDSISDCDISFVPRKGDLGGHDFVALLRQGQLLNVVVAG